MPKKRSRDFDVAIIGGGPAGLSAAITLSRARRRVIVCDHGRPRNYAAKAVHGFLGLDGIEPNALRRRAAEECYSYGVSFEHDEVIEASCPASQGKSLFEVKLKEGRTIRARKLLLATGVKDQLPELPGLENFYGTSIHHCPYCDGWEHRDKRLVAHGKGPSAAKLAVTLLQWSPSVTCCTDGEALDASETRRLQQYGIEYRGEHIGALAGNGGQLEEVHFVTGQPLQCDALFFSAGQGQRSSLPQMLGCKCDEDGLIKSEGKQGSGVCGLFLAGDVDGDVQFAIVAAAEGAIAATAINTELQEEDYP